MAIEKLTTALHEKAAAEQEIYRKKIYALSTKEAMEHSYEYATRENILMALESPELEDAQIRALLASPTPLNDIFRHYDNHDYTLMKGIRKCFAELADDTLALWRDLPVYKYPIAYARKHGEQEQYLASNKANVACKVAIEAAVNDHFSDNCLDTKAAVREVVGQFGYDRMLYVLAVTVKEQESGGQISQDNKQWAQTIPVFENVDGFKSERNIAFVVNKCNPSLINMLVTEARHAYLLTLPLTKGDIQAEALNILSQLQSAQEPNCPNGTHFMAQVSPDFMARANYQNQTELISLLPFEIPALCELGGQEGFYVLIPKDADRFKPLRPGVFSVQTEQLSEASAPL